LADHGNVDNSENLRKLLVNNSITVFPGFEITTAERMHIVCLFDENRSISELNKYLGAIGLGDCSTGTEASTKSCIDIAVQINGFNGFLYAAHITGENGILRLGKLNTLWRQDSLMAAQIPYSKEEIDPKYKNIIQNKDPVYHRDRVIAYINACDIEQPEDLLKKNATTLIKMTKPTFNNFKMAFKDPDSRVKLNYDIEDSYQGCIRHINIIGGYLDGLDLELSDNLTTIIGGRGTGKSTLINIIRYALGKEPESESGKRAFRDMINNNLGTSSKIELLICSNSRYGEMFKIIRRFKQDVVIQDKDGSVSSLAVDDILPTIEIYGQNEIIEMVDDESRIMKAVSRLLPENRKYDDLKKEAYFTLESNSRVIGKVLEEKEDVDIQVSGLAALEEKLTFYAKAGIEDKLNDIKKQATEQSKIEQLEITLPSKELEIKALEELAFEEVKIDPIFDDLNKEIISYNSKIVEIKLEFEKASDKINQAFQKAKASWTTQKNDCDDKIQESLKGMTGIQDKSGTQIATDYSDLISKINKAKPADKRLKSLELQLTGLRKERANIIERCRQTNDEYEKETNIAIKQINKKKLKNRMNLSISSRQRKKPLLDFLQKLDGVGLKSLEWLDDYKDFDVFTFAADIRQGAETIREKYKASKGIAEKIATLDEKSILKIEQMQLEDIVIIELNVNGVYKELKNLSKGQQCTAILNILLLDNTDPLLVDQPEDNLDNAFIANNLVDNIRTNKIKRQYIFATHNANIPVFGDSELIVSMQEVERKGCIVNDGIGSIDDQGVRTQVINILEGGQDAFRMREEKYGL